MEDQTSSPELFLFLASTVHDMKNSVSVVNGTLEALLAGRHFESDPAQAQMAQMLYQTKRLNDNLIQLLALYKQVGKPGYPFDARPQMVCQLVAQVVAQEKILLESKGIALQTSFPPDLIWCFDEDLIIGVLGHAINNAIRYTRDAIVLSVRQCGPMLEIRVEDNGDGFSPALIAAGAAAMSGTTNGVNFSSNSTGLGLMPFS
ncbi:two-component system sensor histidine kinase SenX3 [Oxalobacteraceae bacterium GrIS 1.11]